MDIHAARRARRKAIKADLTDVYDDEEATPPEWVDLLDEVRRESRAIREEVLRETEHFVNQPDIRLALDRRERARARLEQRIRTLNSTVVRLNLLVPNPRFTRPSMRAEDTLRPLYRSERSTSL